MPNNQCRTVSVSDVQNSSQRKLEECFTAIVQSNSKHYISDETTHLAQEVYRLVRPGYVVFDAAE